MPSSGQQAPPVISARGLAMQFGGMRAVDGMSFDLSQGEILALIGPNGAGKTTLFNLIAGSLRPSAGQIFLAGTEVTRDPPEARIGKGLARTFQIPKPFAEMTVLENVLTGAQRQAGEGMLANFITPRTVAAEERAAVEKAKALLDFLTLSRLAHEPARVLSGGQRKLLELARVLMADPKVILLDEPAAGVNPALLEFIIARILDLNAQGTTILLIEHNMEMVARLCGRVIVMAEGRRLTEGRPEEVARDPQVIAAYLGVAA
ncbi:ABC transporter ATP-binding protein [Aestuariivirga sp.]|uniref:ABC transporter ATP-binding protein n=1 Tax=Aestuariivirga sp. TaxID=2650926 RepID=UPI003918D88F